MAAKGDALASRPYLDVMRAFPPSFLELYLVPRCLPAATVGRPRSTPLGRRLATAHGTEAPPAWRPRCTGDDEPSSRDLGHRTPTAAEHERLGRTAPAGWSVPGNRRGRDSS